MVQGDQICDSASASAACSSCFSSSGCSFIGDGLLRSAPKAGDIGPMRASLVFVLAMAMFAPCGCGGGASGNAQAEPAPATRLSDASQAGARFRYLARAVNEALLTESCAPDPALRRATVLAGEYAAVRAFEQRIGSDAPRLHWDVARSDVAYRLASGGLGCWEDSDPRFAARHVEMARDSVRSGLREAEQLAPNLVALPGSTTALPPADSAAFRFLVRRLVEYLQPLCRITEAGGDDPILAPAREELGRLRQRLEGTFYGPHFDLAEADGRYERSITMAECSDSPPIPAAEASRAALQETRRQIARIARIARL